MSYYKDQYRQYQANPKSEHVKLADDVSLIYVPTTTKIESRDAVISHVKNQGYVVKKRSEQIISSIEGSDALCLELETTLEFMEGGGAYLPSLDDNFLADRVVTFPTVNSPRSHIAHKSRLMRPPADAHRDLCEQRNQADPHLLGPGLIAEAS